MDADHQNVLHGWLPLLVERFEKARHCCLFLWRSLRRDMFLRRLRRKSLWFKCLLRTTGLRQRRLESCVVNILACKCKNVCLKEHSQFLVTLASFHISNFVFVKLAFCVLFPFMMSLLFFVPLHHSWVHKLTTSTCKDPPT